MNRLNMWHGRRDMPGEFQEQAFSFDLILMMSGMISFAMFWLIRVKTDVPVWTCIVADQTPHMSLWGGDIAHILVVFRHTFIIVWAWYLILDYQGSLTYLLLLFTTSITCPSCWDTRHGGEHPVDCGDSERGVDLKQVGWQARLLLTDYIAYHAVCHTKKRVNLGVGRRL